MPHLAVDAVTVAAHVVIALQTVMTRQKDSQEAAVLSFGRIEGGTRENIIAETVCLKGILRTLNPAVRTYLLDALQRTAQSIAESFGASCEFVCSPVYDALVNDSELVTLVQDTAQNLIGPGRVRRLPKPLMGTEDFSHYLRHVPGAFYFLGCASPEGCQPLHNSGFAMDDSALPAGAALQAAVVCRYLTRDL